MNEDDGITPARAALITERIGKTFDFMRDVIDDPRLLTVIPDGSTLFFRDVEIPGHRVRLVAYRVPGTEGRWAARMTGATKSDSDEPGQGLMVPASIESEESAEAALDALEELIHAIARLVQEPAHRTA